MGLLLGFLGSSVSRSSVPLRSSRPADSEEPRGTRKTEEPEERARARGETDQRASADVIVIGYDLADALFPFTDPIGKQVLIRGVKFRVIGVFEKQGESLFESTDAHALIPLETYDLRYPWIKRERGVNIATIPKSPELVSKVIDEGTAVLRARRKVPFNKPNDFGLISERCKCEARKPA